MRTSKNVKILKQFHRLPWPFQNTFLTPLDDLDRFVSTVVSVHHTIEKGCLAIDDYVFEPKTLNAFLAKQSISDRITHGVCLEAEAPDEVAAILHATLADWIDFLFLPTPKRFAIYADHDEYTTFYANTKGNLSQIVYALHKKGFKRIEDYVRTF